MPKITVNGQTVQTGERPQTNGRTHGRYTKRIAPATRSIITNFSIQMPNLYTQQKLRLRKVVGADCPPLTGGRGP